MATSKNTEQAHCLRCGRRLFSTSSIASGYGRSCRAKVNAASTAADLTDFKPAQVDSARELIEDGAIVPLRGQVFAAVSSDGNETYLSHPTNCNCPGGLKGRRCYHQAAARLLIAA
ncbi:hypothetical protein EJ357_22570 [Streptomyces cyaneochromogenes]|uniref:SWIM-type domain-containing protein n=1 Tax=Streptomyces cyaneochromogenes TaxID=2496836 RepID=A0A3S9M9G9_9ACTN|nr:DUF6011 domain-containing protein [Streptomyces cyaneochromogenes]AZQ35919.1 hypothetical protein EJ357_22570 [Streptomyces cyaneochromogenes]